MKKDNHRTEETDGNATHQERSESPEQPSQDQAAEPPTGAPAAPAAAGAAPSRSGAALASLSLVVVIVAGAAGFAAWRQTQDQQQSLMSGVKEAQSSAASVKQDLAGVRGSLDSLRDTVKSLKSTVESSTPGSQPGLAKRLTATEGTVKANSRGVADTRDAVKSIQGNLGTLDTNVQSLQASLSSIGSQIKAVDDKLSSQLETAVGSLQQTQHSLQATQQSLVKSVKDLHDEVNRRADRWKADDAEYLIRVASQRLQLARDTQTAITALEGAEQRLKDMGDPSLLQVRKKVTDDIVALRAVPDPDITGMVLTLGNLAKKVDTLPVAGVNPEEALRSKAAANHQASAAQTGGWREFWDHLWSQLKTLVVVRHKGSSSEALVPPDQRFFLRENLKLKLEAARLALLRGDYKAFRDALGTAGQWLSQYFKGDSSQVQGMQESVKKLAGTTLEPSLPDLSGTLKALRDWRATHMNKSAAVEPGRFARPHHGSVAARGGLEPRSPVAARHTGAGTV